MRKLLDPSPARAVAYAALYPLLLQVAKRHGYALAIHGSMQRDFDLIAVPWIEEASTPVVLIRALKKATRMVTQSPLTDHLFKDCAPTPKPHGRIAFSIHVTDSGMYGGYLDISVMPKRKGSGVK